MVNDGSSVASGVGAAAGGGDGGEGASALTPATATDFATTVSAEATTASATVYRAVRGELPEAFWYWHWISH